MCFERRISQTRKFHGEKLLFSWKLSFMIMLLKIFYWKWTNGKYLAVNCFDLSVSQQCECAALLMLYWSYWLHKILLPSNPKYLLLLAFTKIVAIALLVICNKWFLINHAMITLYLPRRFFSFAKRKQFSHLTMWHL